MLQSLELGVYYLYLLALVAPLPHHHLTASLPHCLTTASLPHCLFTSLPLYLTAALPQHRPSTHCSALTAASGAVGLSREQELRTELVVREASCQRRQEVLCF